MSASGEDDNEQQCAPLDSDTKCDVIVGFRKVIAFTSMISCIYIVIVIVALKRYKFIQQRLILYLSIAMFFYTFHYIWSDYYFANEARNGELVEFCKIQGWYHILTAWITFLWVCIITFNVALMTAFTKRLGRKFDVVFWAVAVIPAIIISIIPFTVDAYGPAGIWCWISSKKDDERFVTGIAMQFSLFYGPWIFLCTVMAVTLVVVYSIVKFRLWKARKSKDHGGPAGEMQEKIWKEQIRPLMPFPVIFIATFIFPVINRLRLAAGYEDPDPALNFILWFLHAVSLPLPGLLCALVITLNRKTLYGLKGVLTKCCKKQKGEGMPDGEPKQKGIQ